MNRVEALRAVVTAVKPHMDLMEKAESPPVEEIVVEAMKAFNEEPIFAAAFDAMVVAIATEARKGWRPM